MHNSIKSLGLTPYQVSNMQQQSFSGSALTSPQDTSSLAFTGELPKDTFETKKSSAVKAGIATAVVAAVGGLLIKHKIDANKLKEAAKAVGIEDVNLYKALKQIGIPCNKVEKLYYDKLSKSILDVIKDKPNGLYELYIMSPKGVSDFIKTATHKDVSVPKNACITTLMEKETGKSLYQEFFVCEKFPEKFQKCFDSKKTVYKKNIEYTNEVDFIESIFSALH